jgi:hypothetical protein
VTTTHYTALPLATLTLTAHTRPAAPPAGAPSDRPEHRSRSDGVRQESDPSR